MGGYNKKINNNRMSYPEDDEEPPESEPYRRFCEREDVKELRSGQKAMVKKLANLLDSIQAPKPVGSATG